MIAQITTEKTAPALYFRHHHQIATYLGRVFPSPIRVKVQHIVSMLIAQGNRYVIKEGQQIFPFVCYHDTSIFSEGHGHNAVIGSPFR
jgi:hypothetical protein